MGNKNGGNIDQHRTEKIFAAPPCLPHHINVLLRIIRTVIHLSHPTVPVKALHVELFSNLFFLSAQKIPNRKDRAAQRYEQQVGYYHCDTGINQ
jgi:hypothetical protein